MALRLMVRLVCWLAVVIGTSKLTAQEPRVIQPGDRAVDGRKVPLQEARFRSTSGGASHDVAKEYQVNGQPGILRVIAITRGGVTTVDTTVLLRRTLAPVWRHSVSPTMDTRLEFNGARITGQRRRDGRVDTIDVTAPMPVFDALSADLPLASLDLAEGLHVRLPVFQTGNGFTWMDVTVGKLQSVPTSANAWPLHITEGTTKMIWFVDAKNREQLGATIPQADGSEVRITRQP